jgi:ElaA protein
MRLFLSGRYVVLSIKLCSVPNRSLLEKSWRELTTDELYSILKLRTDVFFVEQRIDEEELDNRDQEPGTMHLWIADDAGTAAYLRVIVDDHPAHADARRLIGRVAVRKDRRGEGLARALIERVIAVHGDEALLLHAQEYVASLYAEFGFESFGNSYIEAGISHISMYRAGTASRSAESILPL